MLLWKRRTWEFESHVFFSLPFSKNIRPIHIMLLHVVASRIYTIYILYVIHLYMGVTQSISDLCKKDQFHQLHLQNI